MAMGETRQVSGVAIRTCQPGDEQIVLDLLKDSFGSMESIPRVKAEISGPYFNREGSFIAENNGPALGCVDLRNFPMISGLTLAFLDHLAPGAILYLRSGGRIEAEYLRLERKTSS